MWFVFKSRKTKNNLFSYILEALDINAPVKQQFVETWFKVIDYAISNPLEYKFLEIFSHSPKISKQAADKVSKLVYPILEIFEKGKREGVIKNIDSKQLISFINGAITSSILRNSQINEKEKKAIILMAWDAIKS